MEPQYVPESKDARMWATICHLSALVMYIGIPFGNIIGPLVIWMIKRNEFPLVDWHGKEALNFQISVTLYAIPIFLLIFIAIGIPLIFLLGLFQLIFTVVAAIKTNNGEDYRYPLTIRFLK